MVGLPFRGASMVAARRWAAGLLVVHPGGEGGAGAEVELLQELAAAEDAVGGGEEHELEVLAFAQDGGLTGVWQQGVDRAAEADHHLDWHGGARDHDAAEIAPIVMNGGDDARDLWRESSVGPRLRTVSQMMRSAMSSHDHQRTAGRGLEAAHRAGAAPADHHFAGSHGHQAGARVRLGDTWPAALSCWRAV
jgi:hypothetical protein